MLACSSVRQAIQRVQSLPQLGGRFGRRPARQRLLTGLEPINDRLLRQPGFRTVPGKQRWLSWWIKKSFLPMLYWNYMLRGHEWFPKHNTAFKEPAA